MIEPFTGAIARAGGATLNLLGQETKMNGTIIRSGRFAVNIRNGCNGVEAMLIYFAAVLAFPASWKSRLLGVGLGFVAIQLVNLIRVVALFLTGVYLPKLFDSSHTVVWQTLVILSGVLLWMLWANRFAGPRRATPSPPTRRSRRRARPPTPPKTMRERAAARSPTAGSWTGRLVRNLLLWILPAVFVWVLVTPFYNRFLSVAGERLARAGEFPAVTRLYVQETH